MRSLISILILSVLSASWGCAGSPRTSAEEVAPTDLPHANYTLDHMTYVGSDSTHHYFTRSTMKEADRHYKVRASQMKLRKTFPLDSGEKPLLFMGLLDR